MTCLQRRPLVTKSLTCAFVHGAGDFVAQKLERRQLTHNGAHSSAHNEPNNWERTGRLTLIGLQFGPILHYVYQGLSLVPTSPGLRGIFQKVLIHQIFFAPVSVAWFFVSCRILEGKSLPEVKNTLSTDYIGSMKVNYCMWPVALVFGLKVSVSPPQQPPSWCANTYA